ncbi:MAG: lysine--tRNA ligase [Lentisphaerae bacterium]|jgi:lysyl-tRNA synthetase, class II|nr:lysine--tRNA ligase [Lentisphaerota bacterium]MBT4817784.1 lysine--tRNA ligase [Lentisphaerota bacterium]MBT5612793.1 lysine--tRNA ligase [Lentisphaerota bacterium]MBT7057619.1 lysine--tRNA ligase [Lentisphaerota bacterium]MBT7844934.1 lysine--tRNA ligase [Lentisphaerota bacterium]
MTQEQDSARPEQEALNPTDIRDQRIGKLAALKEQGVDPYGGRVDGISSVTAARAAHAEKGDEAELHFAFAGRLMAMRKMGKSIFADVLDQDDRIQLYVQKNRLGEGAFASFKALDIGDILSVEGVMFTTRMGEVSLRVESFRLLAKSLRPLPEKWHGLTDIERRYRQRYLDLVSNREVRALFKQRCDIIKRIRRFLDERDFLEMETPMLQHLAGGAAAKPFETYYAALDCPMYMRIAPELYLKRLLVGGFERIYEINRNFRNEGLSRRHNPEFTMVEIYQAYGDCRVMMDLVEELITTVAQDVFGTLQIEHADDVIINLERPWRRVAYADLVREKGGADWYEVTPEERRERATGMGLDLDPAMSDLDVTHEVYEKTIEKTLIQPTFVTRLPAQLVPLAKRCEDDPSVVDVFELEINGQEIAPGYSELNDPTDQRARFEEQAAMAVDAGGDEHERLDEDFLTALEHGMPPAGGMGMGIDRLVMLLTGAESIRDVILFPQLRPTH